MKSYPRNKGKLNDLSMDVKITHSYRWQSKTKSNSTKCRDKFEQDAEKIEPLHRFVEEFRPFDDRHNEHGPYKPPYV